MAVKLKRPIKPVKRYWERITRTIRSPERLLVELITNSTDSYKRLWAFGKEGTGRIELTYYTSTSGRAKIEVKDEAEGIPFKKLRTAIEKYGEDTSGLSKDLPVRGTVGVGLKDVCLLMENSRITTIHDGKICESIISWEKGEPIASYLRKGEIVTDRERRKLGIEKNGTVVKGTLPKDPRYTLEFKTLYTHLCRHYMLRKINQLPKVYKIILRDQKNEKVLKYIPPKGEVLFEKRFYVPYSGEQFPIKLTIKKADRRLGQSGEFREGGLIVVYNEDAVADCSLFGFDINPYARNLYGEVEIQAQPFKIKKLFQPEMPIIDEKRRMGLDPDHPFVQHLASEIRRPLKEIIETERQERKKLKESVIKSKAALDKVLREFNTMARKELKEKRDIVVLPPPPYWTLPEPPDFFRFYYEDLNIKEHQTTVVGLGILSDIVPDGSSIRVTSSDPRIEVTPKMIFIDSAKAIEGLIKERITLLGKKCGVKATITAEHSGRTDEMKVNVIENPLLNPKDGFAFIPDSITIPDGKRKKTDLIIDLSLIKRKEPMRARKVTFSSSASEIQPPDHMIILPGLNVIGAKVMRLAVPLKGKGVKTKGTVTASYKHKQATLNVEVTKTREVKGMFSGFEYSKEDVPSISEYDPDTGKITIYVLHPMLKKHKEMGRPSLRIFVRDIIIRTACEAIVREGIRKGSARFPILSDMHGDTLSRARFLAEVSRHIETRYHKYGAHLLEFLKHCALNIPST